MRSTIAWSYDLLDEADRTLFRRLSAFVGGCTAESAESVCGKSSAPRLDVLDAVASLLDKSLLRRNDAANGEVRFVMLAIIREYAQELLTADDEAVEIGRRHADYYLRLAEEAAPSLVGPEEVAWMDRLDVEHDNFHAALNWYVASDEHAEHACRLAAALFWFWFVRGHIAEGLAFSERVLARATAVAIPIRVKTLAAASWLAYMAGVLPRAREWAEEGLAYIRGDATASSMLRLFVTRGLVAIAEGDDRLAGSVLEEGLAAAQGARDKLELALLYNGVGELRRSLGDYNEARTAYEAGLVLSREIGSASFEGVLLFDLGAVALAQGDVTAAIEFYQDALRTAPRTSGLPAVLEGVAEVLATCGESERATRLFASAAAMREAAGHPVEHTDRPAHERAVSLVRETLGDARFAVLWAEGRAAARQDAIAWGLENVTIVPGLAPT
jgi:tetratricopeptide (TPR) repeat protein